MTIIQKFNTFFKKKYDFLSLIDLKALRIQKFNPLFVLSFIIIFSGLFFISSNLVNKKNKENENNFKEITQTNDFSKFTDFLTSKIKSPYEEISYVIEKNKAYPISINGKTRTNMEFPLNMSKEDIESQVLQNEIVLKWLDGSPPKKVIVVPKRIINFVV